MNERYPSLKSILDLSVSPVWWTTILPILVSSSQLIWAGTHSRQQKRSVLKITLNEWSWISTARELKLAFKYISHFLTLVCTEVPDCGRFDLPCYWGQFRCFTPCHHLSQMIWHFLKSQVRTEDSILETITIGIKTFRHRTAYCQKACCLWCYSAPSCQVLWEETKITQKSEKFGGKHDSKCVLTRIQIIIYG